MNHLLDVLYAPVKRFYKFVLKKVIGGFLKHELDLDQLEVGLSSGVLELRDLELNVDTLNNLVKDSPITIVSGYVSYIRIDIPWKQLLKFQGIDKIYIYIYVYILFSLSLEQFHLS